LTAFDWGFDPSNVIVISIVPPVEVREATATHSAQWLEFVDRALDGLGKIPGVESVSAGKIAPLAGYSYNSVRVVADGKLLPVFAPNFQVTHDYFRTLGGRVVEGREFQQQDDSQPPGVIVTTAFAESVLPNMDPIGKIIVFRDIKLTLANINSKSRK
jgi:hypothetical protein